MESNYMINKLMAYLPNYFIQNQPHEHGIFTLTSGKITLSNNYPVGTRILLTGGNNAVGSYRIISSVPVGDKYIYELDGLTDINDEWQGIVYGQRVPLDFIGLCKKISKWADENEPSNIISHSVGGYYKETVATGNDGLPVGWETVFKKDLARYRSQMLTGVRL